MVIQSAQENLVTLCVVNTRGIHDLVYGCCVSNMLHVRCCSYKDDQDISPPGLLVPSPGSALYICHEDHTLFFSIDGEVNAATCS